MFFSSVHLTTLSKFWDFFFKFFNQILKKNHVSNTYCIHIFISKNQLRKHYWTTSYLIYKFTMSSRPSVTWRSAAERYQVPSSNLRPNRHPSSRTDSYLFLVPRPPPRAFLFLIFSVCFSCFSFCLLCVCFSSVAECARA